MVDRLLMTVALRSSAKIFLVATLCLSCKMLQPTAQNEVPTELKALYDDTYVLSFKRIGSTSNYRFEVCRMALLGAAKEGSCVPAFQSQNGEDVTFSFVNLSLAQPSDGELGYLKEVQAVYARTEKARQQAQVTKAVGIGTILLVTFRGVTTAFVGGLRAVSKKVLGLVVVVNAGIALLKANGVLQERITRDERYLASQESGISREYLDQYHSFDVLIENWAAVSSQDDSELKPVDSVRKVVEDLGRYLHGLEWADAGVRIAAFCLPDQQIPPQSRCSKISAVRTYEAQ